MNKFIDNVIDNHLDKNGNPKNEEGKILLNLALQKQDHISQGYKSNHGRGRAIKKDGTFDYLKMSQLFHKGKW